MQHAWLARSLICACLGLDRAAQVVRVKRSVLALYQSPTSGLFMPADVIFDLETYCGRRIYSEAIMRAAADAQGPRPEYDLVSEACEAAELAVHMQRLARVELSAGEALTAFERRELLVSADAVDSHLSRVREIASRAPLSVAGAGA